jgi:putative Ca2+/H+ antiporter (TMEM165/GDT1 family)
MKTFWVTFATLFVAELGDKTQFSVITLTSKTGEAWKVFLGAASALILVTLLGVLLGETLVRYVPEAVIKKVAAGAFVVIGLLMFFNKL